MAKNVILGFALGALVTILVLIFADKLVWHHPAVEENDIELLERAIEMHDPKVLQLDGVEILYLPITKQSGKKISVEHSFFILQDGVLKRLKYSQDN